MLVLTLNKVTKDGSNGYKTIFKKVVMRRERVHLWGARPDIVSK